MVGDGLNDTPALAAAYVSMAPSSASDVGRMASPIWCSPGTAWDAVSLALETAFLASRLSSEKTSFLAVAYNCIAVPIAVAGLVTPLVAAVAMSASSILVVGDAPEAECEQLRPAVGSS